MLRRRAAAALMFACILVVVSGCGRDDFKNDPRPALPQEIGVKLSQEGVVVSPSNIGAGLVNLVIANLGAEPAILTLDGPTPVTSEEVPGRGNTIFKVKLETGEYEATSSGADTGAAPFAFSVGPDQESAQNDLLIP